MLVRRKSYLLFFILILLTACGQSKTQDLQSYIKEVKSREFKMDDTKIEMDQYQSYAYVSEKLRDPFKMKVINTGVGVVDCAASRITTSELEKYPLDSLSLVGNIQHLDKEPWALIRTKDGTIHKIKTNDYMGQNNGRITKISVNAIELDELVRKGLDGCIKRHTILTLSD